MSKIVKVPLNVKNQLVGVAKIDEQGRIKVEMNEWVRPLDMERLLESMMGFTHTLSNAPINE
jgi:hypothetical protein